MEEERMSYSLVLHLPLKECMSTFNLEKAVCNHGFFMMAPNRWIPSSKTLQRPLRLADSTTSVLVSVSHPRPNYDFLRVRVHGRKSLSSADQQAILEQVGRMLRISPKDERDVREFQEVYSEAKEKCFGRVFRSPSLFEDVIKSMLLCNCTWERTLNMVRALCKLQFEGFTEITTRKELKRKRATHNLVDKVNNGMEVCEDNAIPLLANFPTSKELAAVKESLLKKRCNLGYRASHIIDLAKNVESGNLNLTKLGEAFDEVSYEKAYEKFNKVKGVGPFVSTNILMCMGFYQLVPIDTETIRHLKKIHAREDCTKHTKANLVKEIYDKYAPFQCLAYWFELWNYYERVFGRLSELPNSKYHTVSGSRDSSGGGKSG